MSDEQEDFGLEYGEVERVHIEERFATASYDIFVLGSVRQRPGRWVLRGSRWYRVAENQGRDEVEPTLEVDEAGLEILAAAIDKVRARPPLDALALADCKAVRDRSFDMVEKAMDYFLEPQAPETTTERIRSV